ncbi:hypothetical protein LG943_10730 [Streptomonospora sp. S1-112]|uniref:DUF3558 domain-containing protein n=1 Tax=Streptomonospora mangrovi TaxID=2883123 RepID=A0A9X3SH29_9ACTN|nr:hypothetical protein [Streptomonospora mangrovi]MDA0564794.1 hypothetical protein [Streptomonospora mangrovi]
MRQDPASSPSPAPAAPGRPAPARGTARARPPLVGLALGLAVVTVAATLVGIEVTGPLLPSAGTPEGAAAQEEGQRRPRQYALPDDPCAGATVDQLRRLSAVLPATSISVDTSASCAWFAVFADGTRGGLDITYRPGVADSGDAWDAEAAAMRRYRQDTAQFTAEGSHVTVEEMRHVPGLGEQSLLVYADLNLDARRPSPTVMVFVRQDNMNVAVSGYEFSDGTEGDPDYRGDEDVLLGIAARALGNLG